MPVRSVPAAMPPLPCPDAPEERGPTPEPERKAIELPASLWALLRDWLRPPRSAAAALWKVFSTLSLAVLLASGWLLWRHPELVVELLLQREQGASMAVLLQRWPRRQRQVMELLAGFALEYQPTQIALVGRHSAVGIELIWSNEPTSGWPTATAGVMHANLMPALAAMLHGECWSGALVHPAPRYRNGAAGADGPWLVCGLSDGRDVRGYLLVHWQEQGMVPAGAERRLAGLRRGMEQVLF